MREYLAQVENKMIDDGYIGGPALLNHLHPNTKPLWLFVYDKTGLIPFDIIHAIKRWLKHPVDSYHYAQRYWRRYQLKKSTKTVAL